MEFSRSPADRSDASALHQALVAQLKESGRIRSQCVEAAFRAVPRHLFVPDFPLEDVYQDRALQLKPGASSSEPGLMAMMLEQLDLRPGHHVMEIGAGTGYNAALMAHIVGQTGHVVTLEIDEDLATDARQHLAAAGFSQVEVVCGDGVMGHPDAAPYDRIVATVGCWDIAPAWRHQLRSDGCLLLPLAILGPLVQWAFAFKPVDDHLESVTILVCNFVMLQGSAARTETVGGIPRVRAYPRDTSSPPSGEILMERPWSRLVIDSP
jgi:protein-L-isoaspartate(D-aspartate) O-methyltransferase